MIQHEEEKIRATTEPRTIQECFRAKLETGGGETHKAAFVYRGILNNFASRRFVVGYNGAYLERVLFREN